MGRKSRSRIENVSNINTVWDQKEFQNEYKAWYNEWNQGERWGIIGFETRPKTVVGQIKEHGRARHARSPPESIEYGFGNLMLEVDKLVNSEVVLENDINKLDKVITNMEIILNKPHLNPQNIRFSNVVTKFKAPKNEDGEPIVKRTTPWYGHYRTPAFVQYMKWKKQQGLIDTNIIIPEAETEWGNKSQNKANPPMYQAVISLLEIAKDARDAPKELPEGEPLLLFISDTHTGSKGGLHQINTIAQFAKEVVNEPYIYPGGKSKSKKIILSRLREKFEEQVFEITGSNERDYLMFVNGFNKILGTDGTFTIKLKFPQSAGALRSLMKNIPGLDLSKVTRPRGEGAPAELEYGEGVLIKMADQLNKIAEQMTIIKKARQKIPQNLVRKATREYMDSLEMDTQLTQLKGGEKHHDSIRELVIKYAKEEMNPIRVAYLGKRDMGHHIAGVLNRKENFTGTLESSGKEYHINKKTGYIHAVPYPTWTKKEGKLNE